MSGSAITAPNYQGALAILRQSATERASSSAPAETPSNQLSALVKTATTSTPLHPGKPNSAGAYVNYLQNAADQADTTSTRAALIADYDGSSAANTKLSNEATGVDYAATGSTDDFYKQFDSVLVGAQNGFSAAQDPAA